MIVEAAKWPGNETGGMLFGKIITKGSSLEIRIEKTYIPPEELCVRSSTYFEINPEYAKEIMYNEEQLLYLGNWHKHLGYGGPSHGDHRQIKEFFDINPHRKVVLSAIVDFFTVEDHELLVEVYRRRGNIEEEDKVTLQSFKVVESNISFFSDSTQLEKDSGITKEQIDIVKQELVQVYDEIFSTKDIQEFAGSTVGEKILAFPFQPIIETEGNNEQLDLLILLSFPPDFPKGQVYIDVSSQDLSRNFTLEKHPANMLHDKELIQPFLQLLKAILEEKVPEMLKEPLWKIMGKSR